MINYIDRLQRTNSRIILIINYMLKSNKLVYSYKDSFSGLCKKTVWQQKYVPTLTAPNIGILSKKGKGDYVFNDAAFNFFLYSLIVQQEKQEVKALLDRYKTNFLKKYKPLFKGVNILRNQTLRMAKQFVGKHVWEVKVSGMSTEQQVRINSIAKRTLLLERLATEHLKELFALFQQKHLIFDVDSSYYPKETEKNPKATKKRDNFKQRVALAFDKLTKSAENSFTPDVLKDNSLSYFKKALQDIAESNPRNYYELKGRLIEHWKNDYRTDKIPLPFILPVIREPLQRLFDKLIHQA